MPLEPTLEALNRYREIWLRPDRPGTENQQEACSNFFTLIESAPNCFERDHWLPGHITGSALIVTPEWDQVLLTLHIKLGKWLQLGGHSDGQRNVADVAMREANEESGLTDLTFLRYESLLGFPEAAPPTPFDVDIHTIPARKSDPSHFHYDVRYLIVASRPSQIQLSDESQDLRWFPMKEALAANSEPSLVRQYDKLNYLRGFRT